MRGGASGWISSGLISPLAARSSRYSVDGFRERVRHFRVELRAGAALDFVDRDLVREAPAVGAIAGHRVVGVGDRDDARDDGDVVPLQAERIAATVPPLVVQVHAGDQRLEELDRLQDVRAPAGPR